MTFISTNSTSKPHPVRAISLLSGGLDSQLAVRLLQRQGIEVHAIIFDSDFFNTAPAVRAAHSLNAPVIAADFKGTILSLLHKPRHGFGDQMNPCIDCHAAMLRHAGEIMERENFHFISTGEVLNQRPMSQNRKALDLIAGECGYSGYVLRPLSAKLLPPTIPELRGWVDREKLLNLQGRGRKPQMALADKLGISDYPQPAGGCLLTDPRYAARLKELQQHEGLDQANLIKLLRIGRHFRIGGTKLIVGRNRAENEIIEHSPRAGDLLLKNEAVPGSSALLVQATDEAKLMMAAAICARYADNIAGRTAEITVLQDGERFVLSVVPAADAQITPLLV